MTEFRIPRKLRHAAIQNCLDHNRSNFEKNKDLSNLLEQIGEKCEREIYGVLGSKAKEYMAFREKRKEIARKMLPMFTATPDGRRIKSEFLKMMLVEANKFVNSNGINPDDVKSIVRKYQEESRSVIDKIRNQERILDIDHIPSDTLTTEPVSQWTYLYPPYYYSYGDRYEDDSGEGIFLKKVEHFENYMTGDISCESRVAIYDPDGDASCSTEATSAQLINFQMPSSGRLDVWAYLECVNSSYSGSVTDWGFFWSDANISQLSRFFIAIGGGPDLDYKNFNLLFYQSGEKDDDWSGIIAQPGEYQYCHFISNFDLSAGDWVLMRVGITDLQDAVVDDVGPVLELVNSWILRKVAITAIPS
ncbi:MAG TPA: hypothetical protein VH500_08230 [Nitrososphaeraceae archaeon]|jgi:hypothetical protein